MTHVCVDTLTTIASDNGLSPGGRQAIIWTNAGILLIRNLGNKHFNKILSENDAYSFKMHLKMWSAKWPQCVNCWIMLKWYRWYHTSMHLIPVLSDIIHDYEAKLLSYTIECYSTGVQIVSCTLSSDSVLSERTGLFNPVLCVGQRNRFGQIN